MSGAGELSSRERVMHLLCTCFGLGNSPVAPGTVGTLGGVALGALLIYSGSAFPFALFAGIVVLYLGGRVLGDWAERHAAGKDPQFFVLDEVIGYLVTIAWWMPPSALTLVLGFALFRLFDVWKPWPVKRLERIGGGDGILLDDVMAGIWAFSVLTVIRFTVLDPGAYISGGGA